MILDTENFTAAKHLPPGADGKLWYSRPKIIWYVNKLWRRAVGVTIAQPLARLGVRCLLL
jgi:hypothetical protein